MSEDSTAALVTIAAKVPRDLRDTFAELAKRRGVTPSALLRRLVELEMAGAPDGDPAGEVESAVRSELDERGVEVTSARAAAAVNLARRMDRAPAAGAPNAAQLRQILAELAPLGTVGFDETSWLRLSRAFKRRDWQFVDAGGRRFDAVEVEGMERALCIEEISG